MDLKNLELPYCAWVNFMIYWTWNQEILGLPYCTWINFMIYWS